MPVISPGVKEDTMANRNFANGGKIYAMHVYPVFFDATILIGATGAVTSFVGSMVQSVTRVSTGIYTVKLQSGTNFSKLYAAHGAMLSPPTGLSGILGIEIQNAPNTSIALISGAALTIKCLDAAGVLANPASGSSINVSALCSNSSVTLQGE